MENGEIRIEDPENIITAALRLKHGGYRLIQICAAKSTDKSLGNKFEITYTFGDEYKMIHLRLIISPEDEITSISDVYKQASLYENEMHDLFGINIKMIQMDYHGNFYRINQDPPYKF